MSSPTDNQTLDPTDETVAITFEPPGPGSWEADVAHQSRARGRLMNDLFTAAFTEGFRSCFARYGMPLHTLEAQTVHGWMYTKAKPVGAPDGAGGPPPAIVLKIATRLHPELRRRNRTAKSAIADKLWLRDADTWRAERSDWVRQGRALLSDDLVQLSDAELATNVSTAIELAERMCRRHFELVGPAVATGRLLVAAAAWGLDPAATMDLLRGASPESSATVEPLRAIGDLVAATGQQPATVAELTALSPEIARLTSDYLQRWGWRVLGDDIESPSLMDQPDHLLTLIAAVGASNAPDAGDFAGAASALRARVPAAEHDRFDELVDEARRAYGVLDDHSGMTSWVIGIARRAVIELAERAASRGDLPAVADIWNLSRTELTALASGLPIPDASELVDRAAERAAATEPPAFLGAAPSAPPSAEVFPEPIREMVAAFGAFISGKFGREAPQGPSRRTGQLLIAGATVASGHGVGTEAATAQVVVAADVADAMERLSPGDILVCPFTTAAWNSVFPLLGGIVTAHDGPIGHAAVMAREFCIPAVVGIGAIDTVWDGARATLSPSPPT